MNLWVAQVGNLLCRRLVVGSLRYGAPLKTKKHPSPSRRTGMDCPSERRIYPAAARELLRAAD